VDFSCTLDLIQRKALSSVTRRWTEKGCCFYFYRWSTNQSEYCFVFYPRAETEPVSGT